MKPKASHETFYIVDAWDACHWVSSAQLHQLRVYKRLYADFDEWRIEGNCPACKQGLLVSATLDNHRGDDYCDEKCMDICLTCGFSGSTTRTRYGEDDKIQRVLIERMS